MASEFSFDIVSRVDAQELDNALNQARREIENRFDFKNSKTSIESDGKIITIISDDELKMKNVVDVLQSKAMKRGLDIRAFDMGKIDAAALSTVRLVITLRSGIPKDKSKAVTEKIKSIGVKVTTQYLDEQVRVSAKSKDDLQKVMSVLTAWDFELPLQFTNYR